MKKLCSDVKLDLPANKILFIAIFAFSVAFSQRANPFFSIERIGISKNFENIISDGSERNGVLDLFLFDGKSNSYIYLNGDNYYKSKRKNFNFPITSIKFLKPSNQNSEAKFLFVSEKTKNVGLASISSNGKAKLLNIRKQESIPSKVLIGKFLSNHENKAIVFGINYDGIGVFRENKSFLTSEKIIEKGHFSEGLIFDSDFDGKNDLLLFDAVNGKLLFYLDVLGDLQLLHSISFQNTISKLKEIEINSDKIPDFAFLTKNKLMIFQTNENPEKAVRYEIELPNVIDFIFSDLNNDKLNDLIWLSKNGDILIQTQYSVGKFENPQLITTIQTAKNLYNLPKNNRFLVVSTSNAIYRIGKIYKSDVSKNVILSGNTNSPNIKQHNNNLILSWINKENGSIIKMNFGEKGISSDTIKIPFFPDDFVFVPEIRRKIGKNNLIFEKTNKFYHFRNGIISPVNNQFATNLEDYSANWLWQKSKSRIISVNSAWEEENYEKVNLLWGIKKVVFLKQNRLVVQSNKGNVIFGEIKKKRFSVVKNYQFDKNFSFTKMRTNSENDFVFNVNSKSITILSENDSLTFSSNIPLSLRNEDYFSFQSNTENTIYFFSRKEKALFSAKIDKSNFALNFDKIFNRLNLQDYYIHIFNAKKFLIYYNNSENTVSFIEIK